jgi:glutamyl-tRNA synthetase
MVRVRFAPSPTGDLHVGGAWTALAAWVLARSQAGRTVLRVEDIDAPRVVPGSKERIARDLDWLGLDWDEGPDASGPYAPYTQSQRLDVYEDALARLTAQGLTYPCDCSRTEIARAASAPHAGEEMVYPGTCRDAPQARSMRRPPAIRLRVPIGTVVAFDDRVHGPFEQRVDQAVGDFVLRRGDGVFAYQLAVAIDDAAMEISEVVRGTDLLGSTPRQILLMRLLGYADIPSYAHVPLVVAAHGDRLAKRTRAITIDALRARGLPASEIVATLARGLGLVGDAAPITSPIDVAKRTAPPERWSKTTWAVPAAWE